MRRSRLALSVVAAALLGVSRLGACPLCESETGEQVRAGAFGDGVGYNVLVTALPFPVILGIVALIHYGPPWRPARGTTDAR